MSSFDLLAAPIQRALWNMGWTALRPIQEQAIPIVLQSDRDLIISARTAAGKTEAAFLPVLSAIHENPLASVRAIYIGPLKALINDQFRRLEQLAELAEIPVHRWHGDVSQNRKQAVLKQPGGVLLITPESLEAMFVNRGTQLPQLFHSLAFVVIDELHALLGTERGLHLRSLLFRLQRAVIGRYRLIALSATLGDLPKSAAWLRPDEPHQVEILTAAGEQKAIQYRIHTYLTSSSPGGPKVANAASADIATQTELEPPVDNATDQAPLAEGTAGEAKAQVSRALPSAMLEDVYEFFHGQKNLIFANAKSVVEECADGMNELCRARGARPEFLVHHGSLSREIREEVESLMQGAAPHTTVCSSTLELGIDIGNVTAVGQIGAPHSVNSLAQRLGRSGRKDGEPHCMRILIRETLPDPKGKLVDLLHPELVQAVALTELLLQRWFEPPAEHHGDFSTLVQQILSVLAETGGIRAHLMFERLVTTGAFRYFDQPTFAAVLRSIAAHDLVEQMPEGDLILGIAGQKIVSHYDFYSAFSAGIEYRIVDGSRLIGTLPPTNIPAPGEHLMLGGRRWSVAETDHQRREATVVPARGRKAPFFPPSEQQIHPRVRAVMRDVLQGTAPYAYLTDNAQELLTAARKVAQSHGIFQRDLVHIGGSSTIWFPWSGSRVMRTLQAMCEIASLKVETQGRPALALVFEVGANDVRTRFQKLVESPPSALQIARLIEPKSVRKYDDYLTEELLDQGLASGVVDLETAVQLIQETLAVSDGDQAEKST